MPPVMSNYYLTYKCNSRCTYCDIPIKPENIRIKETSPEVIIENLAALKRLGVKVVDFTGRRAANLQASAASFARGKRDRPFYQYC